MFHCAKLKWKNVKLTHNSTPEVMMNKMKILGGKNLAEIHLWKISNPENIHPWKTFISKNIHPKEISTAENIHS